MYSKRRITSRGQKATLLRKYFRCCMIKVLSGNCTDEVRPHLFHGHLDMSLDSFVIVRQHGQPPPDGQLLPGYQPITMKLMSRRFRGINAVVCFYSAVIFPVEENVSSIIDKFICTISFVQNNNTKVTPISHNITASGSTIVIFPCDFVWFSTDFGLFLGIFGLKSTVKGANKRYKKSLF